MAADVQGQMTRCCICGGLTRNIHWHHTVPQALGGVDSLQIPLDGDCHTTLHAKANAVISRLAGRRKEPVGNFWADPRAEQMAETWLKILVDAMMNPPVVAGQKEILLPMIKVDVNTRFAMELLKRDTPGMTNMSQVLRYCIEYTLRNKGIKDESKDESTERRSNQKTGKKRAKLW